MDSVGDLTNSAQVSAVEQADPDSTPGNEAPEEDDQDAATVVGVVLEADLSLVKSVAVATAVLDQQVTFTIVVTNASGPGDATGVEVVDQLPVGLTYATHTQDQGLYNPLSGLWTVGSMPVGSSATLQLTATVDSVGDLTNSAQVSAVEQVDPDSTPGNEAPEEDDQDAATVVGVSPEEAAADIRCQYDNDSDGAIDRQEAISAATDYLVAQTISRADAIQVVSAYLIEAGFICE